jgi:hypothetical protein
MTLRRADAALAIFARLVLEVPPTKTPPARRPASFAELKVSPTKALPPTSRRRRSPDRWLASQSRGLGS